MRIWSTTISSRYNIDVLHASSVSEEEDENLDFIKTIEVVYTAPSIIQEKISNWRSGGLCSRYGIDIAQANNVVLPHIAQRGADKGDCGK